MSDVVKEKPAAPDRSRWFWINLAGLCALAPFATFWFQQHLQLYLTEIGPHGVADPDQLVVSQGSGYLWKKGLLYPEMDTLIKEYVASSSKETRRDALFRMQSLFNERPTSLALYYPDEHWAFGRAAFDRWVESPGYGIVNKWSFLPEESRRGVTFRESHP